MSHVVTVKVTYKDLRILEKACKTLGWTFNKDKQTYKWYGRFYQDYHGEDAAYKQGITAKDMGKCLHSISIPGCQYEAGVIQEGKEFKLVWDAYEGGGLDKVLGSAENPSVVNPLPQEYTRQAVLERLQSGEMDAWQVSEKRLEDGTLVLEVES